jgi:Zn-dependent protease
MLFVVGFGWAKPVPVNPNNYRHYRRDDIKVSLAGITANLLLFVFGCLVMFGMVAFALNKLPAGSLTSSDVSLVFLNPGSYGYGLIISMFGDIFGYVYTMFYILVRINMVLAVLNILPVPPLDGYHVLNDLVLRRPLFAPQRAAMIGQIVLIALIFTGALDKVFSTVTGGALTGAGTAFEALFRLSPPYPALDLEPYYTGWMHQNNVMAGERPQPDTDRDNYFARAQMYGCVLSGGLAGHVHGTAAYDVTNDTEPLGTRPYFWQALRYRSATYMQPLARFVMSEGAKYRDLDLASESLSPRKADGSRDTGLDGWSFMMRTPAKDFALLYFENQAHQARAAGWTPNLSYNFT